MTKCLICEKNKFVVLRRKLRFNIKRDVMKCVHCGFVFLRSQDKKGSYYQQEYRKQYGPDLKKVAAAKTISPRAIYNTYFPFQGEIVKKLKPILRTDFKVLDVGCSTGHFLSALEGKVKQRVGVELTEDAVKFIKSNLDFEVYSESIDNFNVPEGPFDLITSLQVLEHVEDPLAFLRGIAKNLKKGGYLYLELPNIDDVLLSVFKVKGYEDFYFREPHLSYFSKDTLRKLLRKAGFVGEIKTVQRYNVLNHLHWLQTNSPQPNFATGNNIPSLLADKHSNPSNITNDFNKIIEKADREYKKIVEKYNLGESLCFLGKKSH